jgi:hypothetical protein
MKTVIKYANTWNISLDIVLHPIQSVTAKNTRTYKYETLDIS